MIRYYESQSVIRDGSIRGINYIQLFQVLFERLPKIPSPFCCVYIISSSAGSETLKITISK